MNSKNIIVSGVLGQDGANMAEYLLNKSENHMIYGVMRRSASPNYNNILLFKDNPRFKLVFADLGDEVSINNLIESIHPDYFINFAANSFVGCSWNMPVQVFDTNALGVLRCLEAIRKIHPACRFYSAGSSEEMGDVIYSPQDINHPIRPRSPYGASKATARHLVKVYRESYQLYAIHGILFNHEGIRRSEEFVTRKITKGIARIHKAIKNNKSFEPIELGNLDSQRDWSDSEDFMDGIWRMLNQEMYRKYTQEELDKICGEKFDSKINLVPSYLLLKDYILASGETHSVREFIEKAFAYAGFKIVNDNPDKIQPTNDEKGLQINYSVNGKPLVVINPKFYRPAEVDILLGDSIPARTELGWSPKISFDKLVERMVKYDLSNS